MHTTSPAASSGPRAFVRSLNAADADELARLESLCFSVPWSQEQYRLAFGQRAFAALGAFAAPGSREEHVLTGYLTAYHTQDELEILNLAVHPEHRRRGIARALLRAALQAAYKTGILHAVLEVRRNNAPAIALYEGLGFQRCGVRRGYYPDTGEDALVYTLELSSTFSPAAGNAP